MSDDIRQIVAQIYMQVQSINRCARFKGTEDLGELVHLFKSPQGIEFCLRYHYPNLSTFRMFKRYGMERYDIYIDAGEITLSNPDSAILIGRTIGRVYCDTNENHEVIVMHGAKAVVTATNWAVVFTKVGNGSILIKNTYDNAIIL